MIFLCVGTIHVSTKAWGFSKMVEKSSKDENMRDAIAAVAGPRGWNESRESWLARAARHLGITARTMKSVWYGDITDPDHAAVRKIKAAAEAQGRHEARELADKFDRLASALNSSRTDFSREDVAALVNAARALRGLGSAGADADAERTASGADGDAAG